MKKISTYLTMLFCAWFIIHAEKSNAQCLASFGYSVNAGGNVTFTSTSAPTNTTTQYYWQFGNSTTYTATGSTNASVTYTANGTYTVNLFFLTVPTCSATTSTVITITNAITPTCSINANFSYTQGSNGLVNFNSTSTGTVAGTSYSWGFGDATPNGSVVSTAHTYSSNGIYNVVLYANNNFSVSCADSVIIPITVNSYPCNLNASFVYTQLTNGQATFTSTSTGTNVSTVYIWQFGDATSAIFGNPVSHTYANNGVYIATLTAVNNSVSCFASYTQTITINTVSVIPCNLIANFTSTVGSGGVVNFSNQSSGTNLGSTYFWDFGDGNIGTGSNPSHTYSSAGFYNVLLLVNNQTNPTCIDTVVHNINVTGIPCVANSNFSLAPSTTTLVWNAIPSFPYNVIAATWSWGDNTTSNTLYTSHTYSAAGTYSICLSVTVSCGGSSQTCVNQFIFRSSQQNMQMIQVNVIQPNSVTTAIKNAEIETINWSVFPNPNNGKFDVKMDGNENETVKIKVYSLIGEMVYETETTNDNVFKSIDLNKVSSGIYFIKLNANNKEFTKKIIINK